ncbi:MAG: ACP S-malonyltransferase [Bacillota bacterium]|nr:ACP S-malonyltransferase [Bacillota bacterium]
MHKVAFVFPGQGSQYAGMGRDLASRYPEARRVFDEADRVLGFSISEMCFQGSPDDLALTRNTQPAVLATSVAVFEVLRAMGARPGIVAGHSLGEYSALVAAGSLGFAEALQLVRARGELMQKAVPPGVGAMAAVIGLGRDAVEQCCEAARRAGAGEVEPANFNAPDQTVISGEAAAVSKAGELCSEAGARRVIPLKVTGPFHSRMMAPAAVAFEAELAKVEILDPTVPCVCNVTGWAARGASEVRALLARQICSPVLWEESVKFMWQAGARVFVEVGPGKALTGLVRRIVPEAAVVAAEAAAPLEDTLEFVEGVL